MNREEAQMVAFQLISYAGDAFSSFFKAVEKARNGEFDEADELIKKGSQCTDRVAGKGSSGKRYWV